MHITNLIYAFCRYNHHWLWNAVGATFSLKKKTFAIGGAEQSQRAPSAPRVGGMAQCPPPTPLNMSLLDFTLVTWPWISLGWVFHKMCRKDVGNGITKNSGATNRSFSITEKKLKRVFKAHTPTGCGLGRWSFDAIELIFFMTISIKIDMVIICI